MKTLEDIVKAHEELEIVNNEIIQQQQETIEILKKHVEELRQIIKKHILKDGTDTKKNVD